MRALEAKARTASPTHNVPYSIQVSISPVPQAVIPPDEKLYAKAVIGAVMLAATQGEASKVNDNYQIFLQQGLNIASGGDGRAVQ